MLKKRVKIALMVLAAMLLLYLLPFILYMLVNNNNRQFMFEQLVYKELCYSITQDAKTDSAKIMQVFEYVSNNCRQPQGNENPKYNCTYDVLTNKTASCDQQVWLLMALLRVEDIDAQMVFLRGSDSISHHTVAEVEINKKWVMLDPFYSHHYPNNQGKIASVDDIITGNIPLRDYYAMPESYRNLFAKQYPCKIHSNNKLDTSRRFIRSMLWGYRAILGKLFTMPFEALH
jgi:transglutaminase-like putative cysteine protease